MAEPTLHAYLDIADSVVGLKSVKTILERGTRDCTETAAFSRAFPNATIHAFECNPATLPECRKKVKKLKNVRLVEEAVSDKNGTIDFFPIDQEKTETTWKDGNPGASSLLQASGDYPAEKYVQKKISVKTTTLEDYFRSNKVQAVDLVWMDIQGAELMALQGAGHRLKDIRTIHTEVEFMEIYKGQPLYRDIKRYLNQRGFSQYGFTAEGEYSGDAVFVNTRGLSYAKRIDLRWRDIKIDARYIHKFFKRGNLRVKTFFIVNTPKSRWQVKGNPVKSAYRFVVVFSKAVQDKRRAKSSMTNS